MLGEVLQGQVQEVEEEDLSEGDGSEQLSPSDEDEEVCTYFI